MEQRARSGDGAAAAELLGRYRDDVVRFCDRYLGEFHQAEDAAQDVLATLADPSRWPRGSFRAFLFRLARNHCLNLVKRRKDGRIGVGSFSGDTRLPSPRTGPRTAAVREEEREALRRDLVALRPEHAEVLMLRYFDELSRKEIAEVLEITETVARSRLYQGFKELQRRIDSHHGE